MVEQNFNDLLQLAISSHKEGALDEAEIYYRKILKDIHGHGDANHNFGILLIQKGEFEQGCKHIELALNTDADNKQYWVNYIEVLYNNNRYSEAGDAIIKCNQLGVHDQRIFQLRSKLLGNQKQYASDILNKESHSILEVAKMFKSKIRFLKKRPGERYSSAMTNMNLSNKVHRYFGKKKLKDYIEKLIIK